MAFVFALVGWFMLVTVFLERFLNQDLSTLENFVEASAFKWGIKIFVIILLIILIKGETVISKYVAKLKVLRITLKVVLIGGLVGWILGLGSLLF